MERQSHLSERMRAVLVDWIVEAHKKFKLLPETLFMTVNIIDRYLDISTITREKLQLVGVTALFISAKYEEIYPPPLKDFVELTQKAYSKTEVLTMEGNIVNSLKFNLTVPSSLRFLERYSRVEKLDKRSFFLAQYLLELSLVEYKFVKFSESLKASASIYLTNKLLKKSTCWTDATSVHA
jgi:G2/mitotic-specific cyclin-B, other